MDNKKIVTIPIGKVAPGMIAAQDIYSKNKELIIGKDSIIDSNGIAKITFYDILSIQVYLDEKAQIEEDDNIIFTSDTEKERFMIFNESYRKSFLNIKESFQQILTMGKEIDEQKLVENVEAVVMSTGSNYHVFDMLYNIKDFEDETYHHCMNVAMICNVFADWLDMSEDDKKQMTLCGLLHDLGKLLISEDVLKKPGKLTDEEFELIKQHPSKGYDFLKNKNVSEKVKNAALLHHERCDGTGYPFGRKMNEIDSFAAITAIADVYEAMTAPRAYRKGLSPFRVIKLFEEEGRQQFNPNYLMPILKDLSNTYVQHRVRLNNNMEGIVIMINKNELYRPVVMVENETIDLTKKRDLSIEQVY